MSLASRPDAFATVSYERGPRRQMVKAQPQTRINITLVDPTFKTESHTFSSLISQAQPYTQTGR
jgi:hypothetical protein